MRAVIRRARERGHVSGLRATYIVLEFNGGALRMARRIFVGWVGSIEGEHERNGGVRNLYQMYQMYHIRFICVSYMAWSLREASVALYKLGAGGDVLIVGCSSRRALGLSKGRSRLGGRLQPD